MTVRLDADDVAAAAAVLGHIDATQDQAAAVRTILRTIAGTRTHRAAASGGTEPKRAGRAWENTIVQLANDEGFDWDKAPLRGSRDLLDVTGCIPDGWLIGGKSVARGVSAAEKLSGAMDQAETALVNLAIRGGLVPVDEVIPFQIIQRPGAEPARAYAVTEYGWFLELAKIRRRAQ